MDGENNGGLQGAQEGAQTGTEAQGGEGAQAQVGSGAPPAPKAPNGNAGNGNSNGGSGGTAVGGGKGNGSNANEAADDYAAAIKERDEQIAKLQAQINDAAKNAETAEKLADQITELKEQAESERIEFELKLAGCRNVKAARAILDEHDGSVDALKDAEPWLFDDGKAAASQPKGKTGLNPAGASGKDDSTMKRWRKLAGLED